MTIYKGVFDAIRIVAAIDDVGQARKIDLFLVLGNI